MNTLTWPLLNFRRLVRDLLAAPESVAYLQVGTYQNGARVEWLARNYSLAAAADAPPSKERVFRVSLIASPPPAPGLHWPAPGHVAGHLYLGQGAWRGRVWGFVKNSGQVQPIQWLWLVGAGMHRLPTWEDPEIETDEDHAAVPPPYPRWSRTAGALGGEAVWRRVALARYGVIGAGRSGSLVATSLALLGARQIVLLDPDLLEKHNMGEMISVRTADCGRSKAEAVAEFLEELLEGEGTRVCPVVAPIGAPQAVDAARECDVLCCCADNDAARLAAAVIATLYHRPLLEIGAGVFFGDGDGAGENSGSGGLPQRQMGCDVRLIVPGDGCLLCRGNLTAYHQAVEDLCRRRSPQALGGEVRQPRAGSLASLNQVAGGLGMLMLQDLFSGRLSRTAWAHLEVQQTGRGPAAHEDGGEPQDAPSPGSDEGIEPRVVVRYPPVDIEPGSCALCARAGMGEEGLG